MGKSNQQLFSRFIWNHWTPVLSPDNDECGSDTRDPHAPALFLHHEAQISYLLIYELSCKKPQLCMIHPYKLCKSVVCIYDNKWVLLDGKTQVPRARTVCAADVRYGISVNTSTNPHLQVDSFPKAYQASSITPACQSSGSQPEQIPALFGGELEEQREHVPPSRDQISHHIQPHCSQCYTAKILPHACCCHSIKWWWQPQRTCTTHLWSSRFMSLAGDSQGRGGWKQSP